MAEILLQDAICKECEKPLPALSLAVVVEPDFVVCIECNQVVEESWAYFQEHQDEIVGKCEE